MANENTELTEDKLLGGKVIIFQPKKGYRVAVDSCLLIGWGILFGFGSIF